jgi:DNA repair exonuclease SbcCD nuclease subunit
VEKGYDYWALGHVHTREVLEQSPRIVFPGNLQGRHANETGAKGCDLVTIDAGSIVSDFVALDVVRWHRLLLSCDGVDDLKSLRQSFRESLQDSLGGIGDRLHAVRVELTGASPLHALEARQPGILEAELRGAAQDFGDAEVWLEKVRVAVSPTIDRKLAAKRDDAVGELVRMVDGYAVDDDRLLRLAEAELGALFSNLPGDIKPDDLPSLDDVAWLRSLLTDAESTVLARLSEAGGEA